MSRRYQHHVLQACNSPPLYFVVTSCENNAISVSLHYPWLHELTSTRSAEGRNHYIYKKALAYVASLPQSASEMIASNMYYYTAAQKLDKKLLFVKINNNMLNMLFIFFHQALCLALAILRYNMFVSVFCCMLVEALHLYRMIVIVFGADNNLSIAYTVIGFGK